MGIDVLQKTPLASHTTLQVGGQAASFVVVCTEAQLQEAVAYAQEWKLPITILGGGSNVLVSDEGVRGLVIQIAIKGIDVVQEGDTVLLTAKAGEVLDDVVAHTVTQGWWGIENLSHIPGLIGATPVQNVGAYGLEVAQVIETVRVFDMQANAFEELAPAQCAFGYRDSIFKHEVGKRYVVTAVTYRLSTHAQPRIQYKDLQTYFAQTQDPTLLQIRTAIVAIRAKKFPDWHTVGTAGSFFKNPIIPAAQYAQLQQTYPQLPGFFVEDELVKVPLGWILDKILHVKGARDGNVGTYEEQALVLINYGDATAAQIEVFADNIVSQVKEKTGIAVEWEVTKV